MNDYCTSQEHILAELERIDLLIQAQVQYARQLNAADAEFQGFCISEQEVDALLAAPAGLPRWANASLVSSLPNVQAAFQQLAASIAQRKAASAQQGLVLRLDELARLFQLTSFDTDALLICLAPELDLRYERLYAYLQDDVTKKRPSIDLVLNLLSPSFEAKLAAHGRFAPTAPLIRYHLLQLFDDPSQIKPPLLGKCLKVDERIVSYLFDSDELDTRLLPYTHCYTPAVRLHDLLLPTGVKRRLKSLISANGANDKGLILYFQGAYGVGKQTTAEALCHEQGTKLLAVDGERLANEDKSFPTTVSLVVREALLQHADLYWSGFDALVADDRREWREALLQALENQRGLTFLAGDMTWEPVDVLHDLPFVRVEFPYPTYRERWRLWKLALARKVPHKANVNPAVLATKFRFSGGRIHDAVATARNLARWRDPSTGRVSMDDLYAACRLQSNRKLAALARKIAPHYTWDDIILPPDRLEQLREICNHVRYRARVYDEWGFDRKLSLGKGLNMLFAGPSGTGKTMAAEIIAGDLGLDLYKIDLSTVVSKYIGETEKNLARIFAEAETSNAILFFDEADALFGKRSEVRDAHDRYANVEIAYLLQKMDEYEGIVILATNLRKNMDDAFVRRMHFTVEFPFPSEQDRRRIWEKIWPENTPRSSEMDLDMLARRFDLTGGNIRNIALAAAFLAADDGQVIGVSHLLRATQREYQKMGKVMAEKEFEAQHAKP